MVSAGVLGAHWYESNNQWEVILEDVEDIEFHIESLVQGNLKTEKISLAKFPKRAEYSMRLQIETLFLDEKDLQDHSAGCRIRRFLPADRFPGREDNSFRR